MGKKHHQRGRGGEDDIYAEIAGGIGVLAAVAAALAAIHDWTGLPWIATVLLVVAVLVGAGYGAWRLREFMVQRWSRRRPTPGAGGLEKWAPGLPEASPAADADVPRHEPLSTYLATAGAIGRDEFIRADEATVTPISTGTRYSFLVPLGRTASDVDRRLPAVAGMFGVTRLHLATERSRLSERAVQLLVLDEPPFTRPVPPPTRQEILAYDGVPFGRDVTGKLTGVPTFDKASLLVGGMTQMGKTTLITGIITCLLVAYGEFDLYLLDGKFSGLTRFERAAVRYEASDDPAVFEDMVDELNDRVTKRYGRIQESIRKRQDTPTFRPVFFIVDEAADFFSDDGSAESKEQARRNTEKARSLVAKALESGISTIMLTQRPSQNAIPVPVRDQFLYRICMYVSSVGTAKVTLGDSYFETVAPISPALLDSSIKGQGVLFKQGRSTLIRGFDFPDEFIWPVIDEAASRQQTTVDHAPESPLKEAIKLMQSKRIDFIYTSELAPFLGVTEERPSERGKQLSKLLGVGPSKDGRGDRGYRLADLIAATKDDS